MRGVLFLRKCGRFYVHTLPVFVVGCMGLSMNEGLDPVFGILCGLVWPAITPIAVYGIVKEINRKKD